MHTLSLEQALSLWSDLEQAYHKPENYRTVEIYMYRLVNWSPSGPRIDAYRKANHALYSLLNHFCETREASIQVDGKGLGPWLAESLQSHRVQVTVEPRGKNLSCD